MILFLCLARKGRFHEASCEWSKVRRPWAGSRKTCAQAATDPDPRPLGAGRKELAAGMCRMAAGERGTDAAKTPQRSAERRAPLSKEEARRGRKAMALTVAAPSRRSAPLIMREAK